MCLLYKKGNIYSLFLLCNELKQVMIGLENLKGGIE